MPPAAPNPAAQRRGTLYLRHTLGVRVMHWINVLSLTVLLMSGLMIFNAHPALDWRKSSYTGHPSFLRIGSREGADGRSIGVTTVFGHDFETTGVLGVSKRSDGRVAEVAFPSWITIPGHYSLAE